MVPRMLKEVLPIDQVKQLKLALVNALEKAGLPTDLNKVIGRSFSFIYIEAMNRDKAMAHLPRPTILVGTIKSLHFDNHATGLLSLHVDVKPGVDEGRRLLDITPGEPGQGMIMFREDGTNVSCGGYFELI